MALPESLRPPPVRGAPPSPPKRRRWVWVTLLALLGVGLPTLVVLSKLPRDRTPALHLAGDRFVQAVIGGTETADGRPKTGFELAYELLSPARREAVPFDVFFEQWSRMFDERGFIVDYVRTSDRDARGTARDPVSYLLFLGGEQQEHAKLDTVRLDIVFARQKDRYLVADYTLTDVPNPRACR